MSDETRIRPAPKPTPAAAALPARGRITVMRSPDMQQQDTVFPLRGDSAQLGRDSDNAISLNDPDVSRHHAMIVTRVAQHYIVDLDSTNGTHVNGAKVKEARLHSGDVILIGSTALRYDRAS